jgi:glycosyltransferase involved in cell wall biosynthesis
VYPMRIGIVANSFHVELVDGEVCIVNGGVGWYVKELLQALLEEDGDNEYVVIRENFSGSPLMVHPRVREFMFPFRLRGMAKLGLWREWVLQHEKIDVLHEPEPNYGVFRFSRYPLVITVHDVISLLFPQYFPWRHSWTFSLLAKFNIRRADAIIAVSENTRNDLTRLFPFAAAKTQVIHEAGQSLDFSRARDESLLLVYGINKPYILTVATIEPRKNHMALLDAYCRVRQAGLDWQLVLIGPDGWKNKMIFSHRAHSLYGTDIIQTGILPQRLVAAFYQNAAMFVYPTFYEGFGMPPVEALGAGIPVIVGKNSSLPEILGDAAYYVGAQPDGAEIAAAIRALAGDADLRTRLSRLGKERASSFAWRQTARQTLEVYENIVRSRK